MPSGRVPPPVGRFRAASRAASSCPSRSGRRARRARRARSRNDTAQEGLVACDDLQGAASTTVRPLRFGCRNSKPRLFARRVSSEISLLTRRAPLEAPDLRQLRLRALREILLGAEALDEALEPGDVDVDAVCRRRRRGQPRRLLAPPVVPRALAKYVDRPASSSSTAVVTASRNQRSCATRITAASSSTSGSRSSHSRLATSRWLVGSSRQEEIRVAAERTRERSARQLASVKGVSGRSRSGP